MKNIIKTTFCLLFLSFTSCSDWTETENLTLDNPSIEEVIGKEKYEVYLENLRNYKNRKHKIVYAYYDNKMDVPVNPSNNIKFLPDSLDIVSLSNADISSSHLEEIKIVRKDKGTKFLCNISYDEILNEYNLANTDDGSNEGFLDFLVSETNEKLNLSKEYELDGISVWYEPVDISHMDNEQKDIEKLRQETFVGIINKWMSDNNEKIFVYEGNPQFLIDKSMLSKSEYIVVHAENVSNVYDFTTVTKKMLVDGVPSDRFILMTSTFSIDTSDKKTGYVGNEKGEQVSAISESAKWCMEYDQDIDKLGIGIFNVQNDYFNPDFIYPYTRKSINVLNPSPKNVE